MIVRRSIPGFVLGLVCSLAMLGSAQQSASPKQPRPLPPMQWTPKHYDCHRASAKISIDGKLDDAAWQKAEWTDSFLDIEGPDKPTPQYKTRAKLLWDDDYLYIAAEMEEPDVKATLTRHDSVIF